MEYILSMFSGFLVNVHGEQLTEMSVLQEKISEGAIDSYWMSITDIYSTLLQTGLLKSLQDVNPVLLVTLLIQIPALLSFTARGIITILAYVFALGYKVLYFFQLYWNRAEQRKKVDDFHALVIVVHAMAENLIDIKGGMKNIPEELNRKLSDQRLILDLLTKWTSAIDTGLIKTAAVNPIEEVKIQACVTSETPVATSAPPACKAKRRPPSRIPVMKRATKPMKKRRVEKGG